jgi:hypothetical protein
MKVSTENDHNFGYEKITILVDNIPLRTINFSNKYITGSFQETIKNLHRFAFTQKDIVRASGFS